MTTRSTLQVDRRLFPWEPRFVEVDGGRMHYVDEGTGPPVVLVHGTPVWGFVYRRLIPELARTHRVIVPDHLGFGLSDRPAGWGYRPEDHARNLARLIEGLGLEAPTLVVHDFGGPIGLSYAIERPDNVGSLVVLNSWMWSTAGTPAERISRFMAGPVGRFLYRRLNISARVLLPMLFADRSRLTREAHRHYRDAFATPAEREAPWTLARELFASSPWYDALWARRERIADRPMLLVWGMRDTAFRPDALARWREAFPRARVRELPDAGHFVQEEAPEALAEEIGAFLRATVGR